MQRIKKFGLDNDGNAIEPSSSCGNIDPIPNSLMEVLNLMTCVNRRLEDCAVEWQAALSCKQWRILNAKIISQTSWEQSLLARTYFTDKIRDESFQKLLTNAKTFIENLNNFIASLRREHLVSGKTKNARELRANNINEGNVANPLVTPLDFSLLEDHKLPRHNGEQRRSTRLATNVTNNVRKSFADLMRAKIDLDTKFLGFEAVLNGSTHTAPPSEGTKCLCQICSNVLENVVKKPKVQRIMKTKTKRLTKSPKIWQQNSRRIGSHSATTEIKNSTIPN